MTLNKTKIEWCDYTSNPVTGCQHWRDGTCRIPCYAKKIADRFRGTKAWPLGFEPTFHEERLQDPKRMKKPQTIFICSMADLFGEWVPPPWIWKIFKSCDNSPQHTYIFLTKNPEEMARFAQQPVRNPRGGRPNWWFGTSVTCREDTHRIHTLQIRMPRSNHFISFEPLLSDPGPLDLTGIKQVIIGAQSNPTIMPDQFWIAEIEEAADRVGAKVFCKDSLASIPDTMFRRELCWKLNK